MIRLAIVVEGETEEEFVKSVLAPHLRTREVEATPHLIGGNVTVERLASEMANRCWVSFGGPHEPWDTPEPWFSHYDPERMPPALSGDLRGGDRPRGQLDALFPRMPALTPADVAALRANYAGNVSLIDDQIGQLFAAIERRGEWQNTVVVLCSDHGEMNGDHGLIYKSNFLDSALRVPLLVKGPGVVRGVCEGPVEWFDVGPTLAEFAGTELDFEQFAVSLMPSLHDPGVATRSDALSEIYGEAMVMDTRWKCVVNAAGRAYLLFDLEHDPDESTNLAGMPEYREVEERLRLRILERMMAAQFE
jgi:choline-sulfatase